MKKVITFILCFILMFSLSACSSGNSDKNKNNSDIASNGFLNMGMNVGGTGYYHNRNLMFNDVMKTKNEIGTCGKYQGGYTGELADDGYPVKHVNQTPYWDTTAPVILINDIYEGDYVFLYDGEGVVAFSGGIEVLSSKPQKIYLRLTECKPTKDNADPHRFVIIRSSVQGNHIRNMRMIPIEYENKESEMPLFTSDFLDGLKGMHLLRFMDAQATNSSTQVHWSDRPKVTDWAYNVQGLPLELMIQIANEIKADAWFSVPHRASDDYIKNMAQLIKQKLNPSLKCYIEYSNEVWHEGFSQGKWINNPSDSVDGYVISDINSLVSPKYGKNNRHLINAYFMARTFRIFSTVFTGESKDRLVRVGNYYFWEYPREIIEYLIDVGQKPNVIAGKAYFSFTQAQHNKWNANPEKVTALEIINAVFDIWDSIEKEATTFVEYINEYDIPYVVYEGGQHMQPYNQKVWAYNQAVYDAQIHPKMYELYMKNFELHANLGCKLFANFSYVSKRESQYGSWGALENLKDIHSPELKTIAPKYKAILDANTKSSSF